MDGEAANWLVGYHYTRPAIFLSNFRGALQLFDVSFPNITLWVQGCGTVEIGNDPNTDSFIRVLDEGGMVWSGKSRYQTLDDALQGLERALGQILVGKALGAEPSAKRRTNRRTTNPK